MKKMLSLILAAGMALSMAACGGTADTSADTSTETTTKAETVDEDIKVVMISDYTDITDQSFNQTTYEACKEFCDKNGMDFSYFKPAGDTTADRVAMVDAAVANGNDVVVMPGYAFGAVVAEVADLYPDVKFIALDVSQSDLGDGYVLPDNVFCAVYQEELAGYMAGYAAVKMGYTHLGFLGGMAVPAVMRYGYGFVQGADAAAAELGNADDVVIDYVYGNQFFGDEDITAYMDDWYNNGVEIVFSCGGSIYTSAAEAAAKVGGKIIGVDVDQAASIDSTYGEGMTVTSAMKGLGATVKAVLAEVVAGKWADYGGKVETLGLVSGTDVESNYVQIPYESTQWCDAFTQEDYVALVGQMLNGTITVSDSTGAMPAAAITVNDMGTIK